MSTALKRVFSDHEWNQIVQSLGISPRQADMLKGLFRGEGDKQIAIAVGIKVPTVRSHLQSLQRRFQTDGRGEILIYTFWHFRVHILGHVIEHS